MIEKVLLFAWAVPVAMLVIFIISIPLYNFMLGVDEQVHNGDYDVAIGIPICIVIIVLVLCFG